MSTARLYQVRAYLDLDSWLDVRVSSATHSTWWVIGNTSMGLSGDAFLCG